MQFEGDAAEKSSELSTVREKLSALETRNRELMSEHSSLDQSLQAELEMTRDGIHYHYLKECTRAGHL